MKTKTTLLSTFASLFIAYGSFAGNGKYNLGSHEFKSPNLQPNKSIASIQHTSSNKGITEGGFFFHFNPYLPTKKYLWPKSVVIDGRSVSKDTINDLRKVGKWKFGYGLELGNMFRLVDSDPIAIGLKITWFDFGFSSFKNSGGIYSNIKGYSIDLRAIKIGPYFTYALSDQMAVDAYYQFSPTFAFGAITGDYDSDGDGIDETYLFPIVQYGFTHEMGVTYRFDMLSIGFAYNAGNLNTNVKFDDGSGNVSTIDAKMYASNWRFLFGMKI